MTPAFLCSVQPNKAAYPSWLNANTIPYAGVRIGGHRGYYLRGSALLLNQALQCYATSFLNSRRYAVVQPPVAIRADLLHQLREGKAAEVCAALIGAGIVCLCTITHLHIPRLNLSMLKGRREEYI